MAFNTKYSIGDQLNITDIAGDVYDIKIESIATYNVVKYIANVDVTAQEYGIEIDESSDAFYICSNADTSTKLFNNFVIWDAVIDHEKTRFLVKEKIIKLTIYPSKQGKSYKSGDELFSILKSTLANNTEFSSYANITYEDITDTEEDELTKMKSAVAYANSFLEDVKKTESIRPLIADLNSIDFKNMTNNIIQGIADIQARLSMLDAGSNNIVAEAYDNYEEEES